MANYTVNDMGETVLAVGAPGSLERVKDEYPAFIEEVAAMIMNKSPSSMVRGNIIRAIRDKVEHNPAP